jgi:hypothetical protein
VINYATLAKVNQALYEEFAEAPLLTLKDLQTIHKQFTTDNAST